MVIDMSTSEKKEELFPREKKIISNKYVNAQTVFFFHFSFN
jgi:hypothetical protein